MQNLATESIESGKISLGSADSVADKERAYDH